MRTPDVSRGLEVYRNSREDYTPDGSIMSEDTPRFAAMKRILAGMDPADRAILTIYAEVRSIRETAALLGVGRDAMAKEITRAQQAFKDRYNELIVASK